MFEFDELETVLPVEAYVVTGAGVPETNGIYVDTQLEHNGARIFRHQLLGERLLSRERAGERLGWVLGAARKPLYGLRSEEPACPSGAAWRPLAGAAPPAPTVEGFTSLADASARYCEVLCQEGEVLRAEGHYSPAAEVYKLALELGLLSKEQRANVHGFRAKTFRQLAESKKKVRDTAGDGVPQKGGIVATGNQEDPLHGLAAEWAVEEAEQALRLHGQCFVAAWEGAIAAKHIGWWSKGRELAKKAMQAVPTGPEHRSQRETASTLFLLMAEEEQAERQRKLKEVELAREAEKEPDPDPEELEWSLTTVQLLNDALKVEEFRRPHRQLWKLVGPGLLKKDSDALFDEIRQLVWDKWNPIAWKHGYRTMWDKEARKKLCTRIHDIASMKKGKEVMTVVKEIEDRCCLDWEEIPEQVERPRYDETWAYHKREDGSWGTFSGPTTL